MRRLLAIAAAVALLAGCRFFSSPAPAHPWMRVLVYNIHAGKDAHGQDNLARVADVIRGVDADLVLLQEVDRLTSRSGDVDQIEELARRTGLVGAFGRTLYYQGGEYGIAVLSRWPIASDTLVHLPIDPPQPRAGGSTEPRGLLHAVILRDIDTVHVITTHLDASRDDAYRRQEAAELLAYATALRAAGHPVLIGGDMNSTPESAVHGILTGGPFRDAWPGCGQGAGDSFPDSLPVRRIDYLLLDSTTACAAARVLDAHASDHRAVLFELQRATK